MSFWQQKTLDEMTPEEWESLCDGCAICCVQKIEDEDTGEIFFTNVVCELLDSDTCQCSDYANRSTRVPTCIKVTLDNVSDLHWMPHTCAYRLLAEGKPLPDWHPLISNSKDSAHQAGASVRGRVISEAHVHPDEVAEFVVDWWDEEEGN